MAVRDRNKIFELVTLKGDSGEGQQKKNNIYQDITPETLAQPQIYEDPNLKIFESKREQTNESVDAVEDCDIKNTSIYKKSVRIMTVLAVTLIIATLILVFSLSIFNSLTSTNIKAYSAKEFKFYELKSSMQQEHLFNLTAQNKEMRKTLEKLNDSLSISLLSQASRIQNLSMLTAQNRHSQQILQIEFQVMMEHIDQVNLSVSLLNEFYELKTSMQQEHLLNLTAQNKEMRKSLEKLNASLSSRLLSQASRIQNLSILTTQNREIISAEMSRVNSDIGTVDANIDQLTSNVTSEIWTVKTKINQLRGNITFEIRTVEGNIGQLRHETSTNITNSHSMLRNSLNEVQTTADRADSRTRSIAREQVLVNCSKEQLPKSVSLARNQNRTISVLHTTPSVSYKIKSRMNV